MRRHSASAARSVRSGRLGRLAVVVSVFVVAAVACVELPPKISSIPPSGLSLRVYAFGASAQDARRAFEAVKNNNPSFSVVNQGGDGDVLVGLENDSPKCVPPTALCSMKVSYRIRDNKGETVAQATTTISASSDHCAELCTKALNNVAVKVVEAAASTLHPAPLLDGSAENEGGASTTEAIDASVVDAAPPPPPAPPARASKKQAGKVVEPPPKPQPAICSVGAGPRLPADEAEKRAAQVEVLKRLGVIDQDEYDCLRKAYLARL